MPDKVKLELRPYTALAILKLCREFINDENKNDPIFSAIHESIQEYEDEIYKRISSNQVADALLESKINNIAGRQPLNNNEPGG